MFRWMRRRKVEVIAQDHERVARLQRDRERQAQMEREKRDLFHGLGFDLSDDSQSWLRQAQLMREHHDKIAEMQARIERLEGQRGYLD